MSDTLRVVVHVHPGSSRPGVGGSHGDALVVRVAPRAVDGKATAAALSAVAAAFGVRSRDVTLISGATSRRKLVEVRGGRSEQLQQLIEA